MLEINESLLAQLNSPVRRVGAVVKISGKPYTNRTELKSFTVDRLGEESKFFGFGVCQKANVHLRDVNRVISITTADSIEIGLNHGDDGECVWCFPEFHVTETHRDENTNELSITAYDALYKATAHIVAELGLAQSYTIGEAAAACAYLLTGSGADYSGDAFDVFYDGGANFDGTESVKDMLDAIAQATQTIYYIDNTNTLTFKMLDRTYANAFVIDKSKYFTLDSGDNRRLSKIVAATDLGNDISAETGVTGSVQYIRNNPFYELREDMDVLLQAAIDRVGNLSINQFTCEWRGNYALEIGDCIALTTKDNAVVYSFVLNDSITYDGALSEQTKWSYTDNEAETASNPVTLGDALKYTYAIVDKINKEISLVASDVSENRELIGAIQIDTTSINASVTEIERKVTEGFEDVNEEIEELTRRVSASITAEDLQINVEKILENGVNSVTTTTGFTFDADGLTVAKSDSEIATIISEDGMTVFKNNEELLVANNHGVTARNLHAETYLVIGKNSRFEDYDNDTRTGCFWIGK